ncbi:TPA: NrdH-redoxin [Candidatus Woesearchaeota archaeon]|nr:NrdH-redoxin [Candidatus Woesearchaeota archaeon]
MSSVTIYTTPTCPWCIKAKEFLRENKVVFKEVDVTKSEKGRNEMIKKSDQMGVPVLDINGEIIIGFDEEAIEIALDKGKTALPKKKKTTKRK